jgi:hypothetical protein
LAAAERLTAKQRRERSHSHKFDSNVVPGCGGEPLVACQQRCIERFRKGYIDGVVSREIVPQVPHACQKKRVRIPSDEKVRKIGESRTTTFPVDVASSRVPMQRVRLTPSCE